MFKRAFINKTKCPTDKMAYRDTNLVLDSATQIGTGRKSGTSKVCQLSNDYKSNFMTLFTFW